MLWLQYKLPEKSSSWEEYLEEMEGSSSCGDKNTLQALSDTLGIEINVFKAGFYKPEAVKPRDERRVEEKIYLGLFNKIYYVSLLR